MVIFVEELILVSLNMKVLLLISILELCGLFIWSLMVVTGIPQQMDGDNGSGKETNPWIKD